MKARASYEKRASELKELDSRQVFLRELMMSAAPSSSLRFNDWWLDDFLEALLRLEKSVDDEMRARISGFNTLDQGVILFFKNQSIAVPHFDAEIQLLDKLMQIARAVDQL